MKISFVGPDIKTYILQRLDRPIIQIQIFYFNFVSFVSLPDPRGRGGNPAGGRNREKSKSVRRFLRKKRLTLFDFLGEEDRKSRTFAWLGFDRRAAAVELG